MQFVCAYTIVSLLKLYSSKTPVEAMTSFVLKNAVQLQFQLFHANNTKELQAERITPRSVCHHRVVGGVQVLKGKLNLKLRLYCMR